MTSYNPAWFTIVQPEDEAKISNIKLGMPPCNTSEAKRLNGKLTDILKKDPKRKELPPVLDKHFSDVTPSLGYLYGNSFLESRLADINSNFSNDLLFEDNAIEHSKSLLTPPNKTSTGKSNVLRFIAAANQTETVDVPLYNSGFWITFKAPSLLKIANYQAKIAEDTISAGRDTNTISFNNNSAVINRTLIDLIFSDMISTSLIIGPDDDIRKYISSNDYNSIVLGYLKAQYPKGTLITRYCRNNIKVNDDETVACDHSVSGVVNLSKLLFKDLSCFSDSMTTTLSKRASGSVTKDEVLKYQDELKYRTQCSEDVMISENVKLTLSLSIPNIIDWSIGGEKWINRLTKACNQMFTKASNVEEKQDIVKRIIGTVIAGIYNTVITEMTITSTDDEGNETVEKISDREDIDAALDDFSRNNLITGKIIDVCYEFINNSVTTIIGLPIYKCTKCEQTNVNDNDDAKLPEIIPFNIVEYFFVLGFLTHEDLETR